MVGFKPHPISLVLWSCWPAGPRGTCARRGAERGSGYHSPSFFPHHSCPLLGSSISFTSSNHLRVKELGVPSFLNCFLGGVRSASSPLFAGLGGSSGSTKSAMRFISLSMLR